MRTMSLSILIVPLFAVGSLAHAQDLDYLVSLSEESGSVGSTADVTVTFGLDAEPVLGWSFGVCHDDLVTIDEGDIASGLEVEDLDPDFQSVEVSDSGWTVRVLVSNLGANSLETGEGLEMYVATYTLISAGTSILEVCDSLGDSEVPLEMVIAGDPVIDPATEDGSIEIAALFLRGDVDGSGTVETLPDALFLLRWNFEDGEDPPCMDAADCDDSGTVSGISDAVFLLRWGFVDGDDPPAPGTGECGRDPVDDDPDETSCDEVSKACD